MPFSPDPFGFHDLSAAQWQLVENATQLYRQAAPIIKSGASRHFGDTGPSWRHPRGWKAVRRLSSDSRSILLVIHTFADAPGTRHISTACATFKVGFSSCGLPGRRLEGV